jgi:hypothetical protein
MASSPCFGSFSFVFVSFGVFAEAGVTRDRADAAIGAEGATGDVARFCSSSDRPARSAAVRARTEESAAVAAGLFMRSLRRRAAAAAARVSAGAASAVVGEDGPGDAPLAPTRRGRRGLAGGERGDARSPSPPTESPAARAATRAPLCPIPAPRSRHRVGRAVGAAEPRGASTGLASAVGATHRRTHARERRARADTHAPAPEPDAAEPDARRADPSAPHAALPASALAASIVTRSGAPPLRAHLQMPVIAPGSR